MGFLRMLLRRLGLIRSDYADRVTWPQYWDKERVLVFRDSTLQRDPVRWDAVDAAMYEWREVALQNGVNLLGTMDAGDADITIRFAPLLSEHRGHTHADPDPARPYIRQKTLITIADRLTDPAEIRRVCCHELGHALFVGEGHSDDPGDVMYTPVRAQGPSWRDKNTLPIVWRRARELDGKPA